MTRPKLHLYLALPLLLVFFAQTMQASRRLSLTYDEPIYTALGYADWVTRNPRWHQVIGHPPLVNLLTSWPLLLGPTHPDPTQVPGWGTEDALGFSRALVVQLGSLDRVALVTRLPVMGLALLLAALVYRWAQQTWGGAAGLLALGLYVFDPALLAHGQLNTTDIGVTAFGVMGCYALARYLRRPSRWAFLGAGLALGAALASKASGPFWLGAAGLVMALYWRPDFRSGRRLAFLRRWLVRLAG
ncbi:MAG TPA: phospholipid carrier-dependent glycosyltransferase, partial [Chloroflexi bacterium]|nr:phospholipid carrier-dependent glycosyltransferase [Chloroflexota bacterium]